MIRATAPAGRRSRYTVWVVAMTALVLAQVLACAVSVPPSGGPQDKTPPKVEATVPARDSAGVAADSPILITFSEDMSRGRIERLLQFAPPVVIEESRWDGRTVVIYPRDGLHPDTTYLVTLKAGIQDNHRVASKNDFRFAFATSAYIDSGHIAGSVLFRRERTKNGVVNCYVMRDTAFVPAATRPDRQARVGKEGNYTIGYLASAGRPYIVWAFEDRNNNQTFDPDGDIGYVGADTISLSADAPFRTGVDFAIVDPDEPAVVSGRIINESGVDTIVVSVALYADGDSLPPLYYTACDTAGVYEFSQVSAGRYELRAFVDLRVDSLCGDYPCGPDSSLWCVEPCVVHPDSVIVAPGETLRATPIELRAPAPSGRREGGAE